MARVYLSLGSNIEKEKNIGNGLASLNAEFGEALSSRIYESEAVGFEGDNFYNLVVRIDTHKSISALSACLREIENNHGRDRNAPKFSARSLDIDILTYDDLVGELEGVELPRKEILEHAFVLWPLSEIAPDDVHPLSKTTYQELWAGFDLAGQHIWQLK